MEVSPVGHEAIGKMRREKEKRERERSGASPSGSGCRHQMHE